MSRFSLPFSVLYVPFFGRFRSYSALLFSILYVPWPFLFFFNPFFPSLLFLSYLFLLFICFLLFILGFHQPPHDTLTIF